MYLPKTFDRFFFDRFFEESDWPPADVQETSDGYFILLDLPGLEKKDIKITMKDGILSIAGKREKKEGRIIERYYGSFSRSFRLNTKVTANKISANFKNGVLEIAIPKEEGKEIEVAIN